MEWEQFTAQLVELIEDHRRHDQDVEYAELQQNVRDYDAGRPTDFLEGGDE